MLLEQIKPELLSEYIGTEFKVADAQPFSLTLIEVVEHTRTAHNLAFSLFFRGPVERFMPQGMRRLKHAYLGELEIFLVPTAQETDGFQYEAAFNQLF